MTKAAQRKPNQPSLTKAAPDYASATKIPSERELDGGSDLPHIKPPLARPRWKSHGCCGCPVVNVVLESTVDGDCFGNFVVSGHRTIVDHYTTVA